MSERIKSLADALRDNDGPVTTYSAMALLPDLTLREPHPFAGRDAYQCSECNGISYPENVGVCPYCADDDDA